MISSDASLKELAVTEHWTQFLHLDPSQVEDFRIYKRICFKVCELREVWRFREPRVQRLFCDSFVLCLRFEDTNLYCGLNNGSLQLWDTDWTAKRREQQIHAKGVKCLDVGSNIFVTGNLCYLPLPIVKTQFKCEPLYPKTYQTTHHCNCICT